ncbi:MAG: DUF1361 domain-containing protein [Anaerolineales bacterium]
MKNLFDSFSHNKYRLTIFFLLAGATLMAVVLVRLRIADTDSPRYVFLVWNLGLAWIPFIMAYIMYTLPLSRRALLLVAPCGAFLWLIFFPNAPYILTDFQHLSVPSDGFPVWYDVLLLIWASFTGLFLGLISLFLMQEIVQRTFGRWIGWGFVLVVTVLTGMGVYMGRFLRWNSWDLLAHFGGMAQFTLYYVLHPTPRSLVFAGLFVPFFLFVYLLLYAFGHLLLEQRSHEIEKVGE